MEAKPDYENANLNIGLAYKGLGKRGEAIQSFQEELECHPDNVHAYVELGLVYKESGDYRQALLYYKKALASPDLRDAEEVRKAIASIEKAHGQKKGKES